MEITCKKPTRITYGIFDSLVEACKYYRNQQKDEILTLSDKIKNNPEVEKMIGGGIFWIWNDHYDEVMYSDFDTDVSPATGEDLLTIADELYNNAIEKAMFGIFFNADSKFSEPLYKKYGYLSTQYDNYNDVLNPELLSIIPNNRVKNCDYTFRRMKDYPRVKDIIVSSYKKIQSVTEKTSTLPMTNFEILTKDYMVQRTVFGNKYEVVANFSDKVYYHHNTSIESLEFVFNEI